MGNSCLCSLWRNKQSFAKHDSYRVVGSGFKRTVVEKCVCVVGVEGAEEEYLKKKKLPELL